MAKKTVETKDKIKEIDSDFADEVVLETPKKEEPVSPKEEPAKKEEKKDKSLYKTNGEEEKKDIGPVPAITDELLSNAESARNVFFKSYKKKNTKKSIVSAFIIAVMLAGWVMPSTVFSSVSNTITTLISLVICAICLVGLGVYGHYFRKESDAGIKAYFTEYYKNTFEYALKDLNVSNFNGSIDDKLTPELFNGTKLYKDVIKTGSRYFSTFNLGKIECCIVDTAAQCKKGKSFQTLYVGKFLTSSNTYKGSGIYIYFKGNSRAIPPNDIQSYPVIKDSDDLLICGENNKNILTPEFFSILRKFETNATLVDLAISIQKGKTYFCFGYEDNLMVIPLQNQLDPRPYEQFRSDMSKFEELSNYLNSIGKVSK